MSNWTLLKNEKGRGEKMHLQINKTLEWNKFTPSHSLPSERHIPTQGRRFSPRALMDMCPGSVGGGLCQLPEPLCHPR